MAEIIMHNMKEKLLSTRKNCVGMSEEIYAITDYMSSVVNNSLDPIGLAAAVALVQADIENGDISYTRNNYFTNASGNIQFPKYLVEHKNQALAQLVYFPQVIDEIAEPQFAQEFREVCKKTFGFDPPKRIKVQKEKNYAPHVKSAIDWWGNAITSPKLDNGSDMNPFVLIMAGNLTQKYTEEEIALFKDTLAEEILKDIRVYGRCCLEVDYNPCHALAVAGNKIGVEPLCGYPWKTTMYISEKQVEVSPGYGEKYRVIWTSKDVT